MRRYHLLALMLAAWLIVSASALRAAAAEAAADEPTLAQLEKNANLAFDRKQYMQAIPLYQRMLTKLERGTDKYKSTEEKLRVAQRALADQMLADPQSGMTERKEEVKTAPEERKKHVRPKDGEVYGLTIKELGNFEYDAEKGGGIPNDVTKLTGAKIRLSGFMIPLDQADNITEFALVPSLFACCFGAPPAIQHTVVVHTPKGKAVGYYPDEILVEGLLKVEERKEDGLVVSVFEITCTSVKPAPKAQ